MSKEKKPVKYVGLSHRERQAINAIRKEVPSVLFIFKAKNYSWTFLNFTFILFTDKFYYLMIEIHWVVLLMSKTYKLNLPCCFDFFFFFFFFFCFGL